MSTPTPLPKPANSPADEPTMMGAKIPIPEEPLESDDRTYVYKPSEIAAAANKNKPTTVGLLALVDQSVIMQDLTRDKLLEKAPRIDVDGKIVPALGGIPLFGSLGQGAMGAVFYGVDPKTRTSVALKVFPTAMTTREAMERLYEQVRHIRQLNRNIWFPSARLIVKSNSVSWCSIMFQEFPQPAMRSACAEAPAQLELLKPWRWIFA